MNWKRATFIERKRQYVDYFSEDGKWKIAEGYDTIAAQDGFPFSLFEHKKGEWRFVRLFAELRDAKKFAERRAA